MFTHSRHCCVRVLIMRHHSIDICLVYSSIIRLINPIFVPRQEWREYQQAKKQQRQAAKLNYSSSPQLRFESFSFPLLAPKNFYSTHTAQQRQHNEWSGKLRAKLESERRKQQFRFGKEWTTQVTLNNIVDIILQAGCCRCCCDKMGNACKPKTIHFFFQFAFQH